MDARTFVNEIDQEGTKMKDNKYNAIGEALQAVDDFYKYGVPIFIFSMIMLGVAFVMFVNKFS